VSLRALAKLRTFDEVIQYVTLFPVVARIEKLMRSYTSAIDLGFADATWLRFSPFEGERIRIESLEAALRLTSEEKVLDSAALSDIRRLALPPGSADAVLCFDVLEHVPKEEGQIVLRLIQTLARRVVVLGVPNGFIEEVSADGNKCHVCGWEAPELRAEGFEVHGFMGLKNLRGDFARISRKPHLFWWLVSKLSEPYVWNRPERAFALFAVKKLAPRAQEVEPATAPRNREP